MRCIFHTGLKELQYTVCHACQVCTYVCHVMYVRVEVRVVLLRAVLLRAVLLRVVLLRVVLLRVVLLLMILSGY